MKMAPRRGLNWSFSVVLQLFLFSNVDSRNLQGAIPSKKVVEVPSSPGVQLLQLDDQHVSMSNGLVNVTFTVPDGDITEIKYKQGENILESYYEEAERGRWNVVWNGLQPGKEEKILDGLQGTNYTIIEQNENQVEISFTVPWNSSSPVMVPLNIDKRYIMLKNSSGFYSYAIFEHPQGWPAFSIQVGRLVFKLRDDKFNYMAVSDMKQRYMPSGKDRNDGKTLQLKEAVLLTNPANPQFKGEVDDKYFYACDNKESRVHGWVSNDDTPVGFWMITPSNEFRSGGPFKQDLTSHVSTTVLSVFSSRHYVGHNIDYKFANNEYWKKVIGPVYVYLNSDASAKTNPSVLWNDAKLKMETETTSWPYDFPRSTDYLKSNQRGALKGKFLVSDRITNGEAVPAALANVGLATPGPPGSWQTDSKGYQFWTQTDEIGNFLIKNVIPGNYRLYAWANGTLGDYVSDYNINILPGYTVDAGNLVFEPPRRGATLWEIGIPDRTAKEFFVPNPSPELKVHKYGAYIERFKQYGLWDRYAVLYPMADLVFTIGKSDYKKDWYYAQVTRQVLPDQYNATTWQIQFELDNVVVGTNYTLQVALASANGASVQVHFNDLNAPPCFTIRPKDKDNALARYGDHGIYHMYSIVVPASMLTKGQNTIFLAKTSTRRFSQIMYDYIRFEGPSKHFLRI